MTDTRSTMTTPTGEAGTRRVTAARGMTLAVSDKSTRATRSGGGLALGCLAVWRLGDSIHCCCLLVILLLSLLIFRNLTD